MSTIYERQKVIQFINTSQIDHLRIVKVPFSVYPVINVHISLISCWGIDNHPATLRNTAALILLNTKAHGWWHGLWDNLEQFISISLRTVWDDNDNSHGPRNNWRSQNSIYTGIYVNLTIIAWVLGGIVLQRWARIWIIDGWGHIWTSLV